MCQFFLAVGLCLAGCSTFTSDEIMQSAIGLTISDVAIRQGPPDASFDVGNGRRAFQCNKSETHLTGGHATVIGDTVLMSPTQLAGHTCIFTLYATGGVANRLSSWKIVGYEPNEPGCN